MGGVSDFLLELLSEEIPARMQDKARDDLSRLFAAEIARAGLKAAAIETFASPRRLVLIARGLPAATEPVVEEVKGPRADAPAQALAGFLGKTGLTREQLVERTDAKGNAVLFAVTEKPGRATADVLGEAVAAVVRGFPWPKSMRWGAASREATALRWVRPLSGIVALFGDEVVPVTVDGIAAGATTVGHRFHHPGIVTIGSAADYAAKLRACHVIVDQDERRRIVRERAAEAAAAAGLSVVPDEGLVAENAGLTEWPVPLLGRFDPAFLTVPREVIQLTMRTNQKYFALVDGEGRLAPNFVCTANIEAGDGGRAIVAGNEKVLSARLSDARFFWEQDLKVPLADQAAKLSGIVFHEKLGTIAEKVDRVAEIASEHLFEPLGWPEEMARNARPLLKKAAKLSKADLVSGTVGEFPELQGIIGGHIADDQHPEVATALREHYLPAGLGDALPSDEIGKVVGLADRADTLYGFFGPANDRPTGSKDPFALRRAALGVIRIIVEGGVRIKLNSLFGAVDFVWQRRPAGVDWSDPTSDIVRFIIDRLKVQQREAGVRHDLIDAVFALGGEDDLVRLLARVRALQAFVASEDGANLLAGYKRAANILRIEEQRADAGGAESLDKDNQTGYTPLPEEAALQAALDKAERAVSAAVADEDFAGAMRALSALRGPIDGFFDRVKVNDEDRAKRAARLSLLSRIRGAMHLVADFSRIEG